MIFFSPPYALRNTGKHQKKKQNSELEMPALSAHTMNTISGSSSISVEPYQSQLEVCMEPLFLVFFVQLIFSFVPVLDIFQQIQLLHFRSSFPKYKEINNIIKTTVTDTKDSVNANFNKICLPRQLRIRLLAWAGTSTLNSEQVMGFKQTLIANHTVIILFSLVLQPYIKDP